MRTLLILATAAALWQSLIRDTNSRAASSRGAHAYQEQKYDVAALEFRAAASISSHPQRSFNLGTAQVAAGRRAEGSATLSEAMRDPAFRADALYNRGNSALAAKAYEHAVRDYTDVLRLRPKDAQAKRNLEIALTQLQSLRQQQKTGGAQQQPPQGASQPPQPQPSPSARPEGPRQDADADALLRSVQQQEQEELARMKRARAGRARVGW